MTCAGLGLALRRFPSVAQDAALARFAGPALSGHFLCAEFREALRFNPVKSHFFRAAAQLTTLLIGDELAPSTTVFTRNRWPSAVTE